MRPTIRKRAGEELTDSAIEAVIKKLESDTPITKKAACAALSITYNTTRLTKIIEEYKERKEFMTKRKKELRNTPVSTDDASYIVSDYLEGQPLRDIADRTFRSIGIVKRTLAKYNIPIRSAGNSYHDPIDLGYEGSHISDYTTGDLVYSARYGCPAEIRKVMGNSIYRVWLFDANQYAYQPSYELSDLRKVQSELDVKIEFMSNIECLQEIQVGLRKAKKKVKE